MTSFNDNDGIPASGNGYTEKILRDEDGNLVMVVVLTGAIRDDTAHGLWDESKQVAEISSQCEIWIWEMVSGSYVPQCLR